MTSISLSCGYQLALHLFIKHAHLMQELEIKISKNKLQKKIEKRKRKWDYNYGTRVWIGGAFSWRQFLAIKAVPCHQANFSSISIPVVRCQISQASSHHRSSNLHSLVWYYLVSGAMDCVKYPNWSL